MFRVDETDLPGVGTRFAFQTEGNRRLGVIRHNDGRRELFVADQSDPDCVAVAVSLDEGEAHVLADLLGGTEISREAADLSQGVAGLTVDWIDIPELGPRSTIGELGIRERTGASVVAVLRSDDPHASPGPDFALLAGDVALVVGTAEGVRSARRLLEGGEASS